MAFTKADLDAMLLQPEWQAVMRSGERLGYDGDLFAVFVFLAGLIAADKRVLDLSDDQLEAEVQTLGAMMLGQAGGGQPSDFADPWHKIVFLAIDMVRAHGRIPDPTLIAPLTVNDTLCAHDPLGMLIEMTLTAQSPSAARH